MPEADIQLNELTLACPVANVRLVAMPILSFVFEDVSICSLSSSQVIQSLRRGRMVVKRGPGCAIKPEIYIEGLDFDDLEQETLQKELTVSICHAPWWKQLPISCSLSQIECENLLDPKPTYSLSIVDTLPNFTKVDATLIDTQAHDVKIPPGIPTLELQCIYIKMTFQPYVKSIELQIQEVDAKEHMLMEHHTDDEDDSLQDLLLETILCSPILDDRPHFSSSPPRLCSLENTTIQSPFEDDMLMCDFKMSIIPGLRPDTTPSNSQDSFLAQHAVEDNNVCGLIRLSKATVGTLVDAATRTLVGGSQAVPTPGVELYRPLPRHALATLMPLLFSPGFQKNMSERSKFLPTITNTISLLASTVQSNNLREKLKKLREKSTRLQGGLSSTVQAHTFRIMHNSLFDRRAASRLRTHSFIGDAGQQEEGDDSMMMDTSLTRESRRSLVGGILDNYENDSGEMLEVEPLSDDELDMLLDLEIMREQHGQNSQRSLSIQLPDENQHEGLLRGLGNSSESGFGDLLEHDRFGHDISMIDNDDGHLCAENNCSSNKTELDMWI